MKKFAFALFACCTVLANSGCSSQSQNFYAKAVAPLPSTQTVTQLSRHGHVVIIDVPAATNSSRNLLDASRLRTGIATKASTAIARDISASEKHVTLVTGENGAIVAETIAKALKDSTPNSASTLAFFGDSDYAKSIGDAVRLAGMNFEYVQP